MKKLQEITLVFQYEKFRFDETETVIAVCRKPPADGELFGGEEVTVKVVAKPGELVSHLSYRFYGTWRNTRYGRQLHARTFVRCRPHGQAGIVKYLQRAPHIGPAIAANLWEAFGSDAVRIVRETPDVAAAACRLTEEQAALAAKFLQSEAETEDAAIDLVDLLGGRGFPRDLQRHLIHRWGSKAAELVRKNPYLLMQFSGAGFGRADKLYLDLGHDPNRLKRQTLCLWQGLQCMDGDTWMTVDDMVQMLRKNIGGADIKPARAAQLGVRAGLLISHRDDQGGLWFTDSRAAKAEATIAECVARLVAQCEESPEKDPHAPANLWPFIDHLPLSDHQKSQMSNATLRRIGILGGGPGTGKSYCTAHLAKKIVEHYGLDDVCVLAPTGKAAVRVTELMAGYGVPLGATTIHRGLGCMVDDNGWTFEYGPNNPLPCRFVLVDESSMIDAQLLASLISAIGPLGHLLLVGDINQLPPVGRGAPLRDLIDSGRVPYGELTEIRRNSGRIVRACHEIRQGRRPEIPPQLTMPEENLALMRSNRPQDSVDAMLRILERAAQAGHDPIWDVQVICALNDRGDLSRKALNELLQRTLNKRMATPGCRFKADDKIVCLKNGKVPVEADHARRQITVSLGLLDLRWPVEREEVTAAYRAKAKLTHPDKGGDAEIFKAIHAAFEAVIEFLEAGNDFDKKFVDGYVANGELGRVLEVNQDHILAQFTNPDRRVKIWRTNDGDDAGPGVKNFDLGYALSCHKCQGSEFPTAIVMLDDSGGARRVCSREWLYTAISRAKERCFLIGRASTALGMVGRVLLPNRKTFLTERIKELCHASYTRPEAATSPVHADRRSARGTAVHVSESPRGQQPGLSAADRADGNLALEDR